MQNFHLEFQSHVSCLLPLYVGSREAAIWTFSLKVWKSFLKWQHSMLTRPFILQSFWKFRLLQTSLLFWNIDFIFLCNTVLYICLLLLKQPQELLKVLSVLRWSWIYRVISLVYVNLLYTKLSHLFSNFILSFFLILLCSYILFNL